MAPYGGLLHHVALSLPINYIDVLFVSEWLRMNYVDLIRVMVKHSDPASGWSIHISKDGHEQNCFLLLDAGPSKEKIPD